MSMKRIIPLMLVAVFVFLSTLDAEAQRKRKRRTAEKDRTEDPFNKTGQFYQEIKFGNIYFQNGFNIAMKYTLGYNFTKQISLNLSPKMRYSYFNPLGNGQNLHLFDRGLVAGLRGKITESIYLQAEYGYHNVDVEWVNPNSLEGARIVDKYGGLNIKTWRPLIGGGYITGQGPWKFGTELLLHTDGDLQEYYDVIEYWFSLSYNF